MKYDAQNICTSRKVVRESLASASDASRAFRSAVGLVESGCDKSSLLGMRRREDKLDFIQSHRCLRKPLLSMHESAVNEPNKHT